MANVQYIELNPYSHIGKRPETQYLCRSPKVNTMPLDLQTIDERLAKAKEEADFWEKARAILADPRLQAMTGAKPADPRPRPITHSQPPMATAMPRAYGELQTHVYEALPEPDAGLYHRVTTQQIVESLLERKYVFIAKEPTIAVNGALIAMEGKQLVEWAGKRGNAKLWRKKRLRGEAALQMEEPAEAGS
jgi:hypothetical protein